MASFLVDYENVYASDGLCGVEFLTPHDSLYIFYSETCWKIKRKYVDAINRSGCDFHICDLYQPGKNAIDFYIASMCGVLVERGETEICIITNDKGFQSIIHFFTYKENENGPQVKRSNNIEKALIGITSKDNLGRRMMIGSMNELMDIYSTYSEWNEKRHLVQRIKISFAGTIYAEFTEQIIEMVKPEIVKHRQKLYFESMHRFGIEDGRNIYREIKMKVLL